MSRLIAPAMVAALVISVGTADVLASKRTRTGKEAGYWSPESRVRTSVVYADVTSAKNVAPSTVALMLDVRATLSGTYDAAARPVLEADLTYGFRTSVIRRPPPVNAHVVVVVEQYPNGRFYMPTDFMLYMPGAAGLVVVAGFDDPKVTTILSRLREVRSAKPQEHGPDLDELHRLMERARKEAMEE